MSRQIEEMESELIGYVRAKYELDELDEDPEILDPDRFSSDE